LAGEVITLAAVLMFATSNSMYRKIENDASPSHINAFRTVMGTLAFILIVLLIGELDNVFLLSADIWLLLIASIIFGQVVGDTAYFKAQLTLGTTIALAVSMTFPFFTFILSMVFLNTYIPVSFYISGLLIGSGVLLIGMDQNGEKNKDISSEEKKNRQIEEILRDPRIKALIMALLAAIAWAIGAVLTEAGLKSVENQLGLQETSSLVANAIRFPFAAIILVFMAYRQPTISIKNWDRRVYSWLLVASFFGTVLGAYFYTEANRLAGAAFISLIATASPLFALPITWILNGERISKKGFAGVILTITGVTLILI